MFCKTILKIAGKKENNFSLSFLKKSLQKRACKNELAKTNWQNKLAKNWQKKLAKNVVKKCCKKCGKNFLMEKIL